MHRFFIFILGVLLLPMLLEAQAQPQPPQTRDAEIRTAIETYVRQKTEGLGYEINIKRISINGTTALPEGRLNYEIIAPQQWEGWGSTSIAVIVRHADQVVRNIPGRVKVEALAEMAVALRQLDYGSVVTAEDVGLRKMDIAGTRGHYLSTVDDVVGKKTRSTIRPNTPIKPNQLEKVSLIKSGQIVTIVAENERVRVTLTGKARNSGGEGDIINVQNLSSLKEFSAQIVDATTVRVAF